MKFARSVGQAVYGIILIVFLLAIGANVCDDRCSRNMADCEETWEELHEEESNVDLSHVAISDRPNSSMVERKQK